MRSFPLVRIPPSLRILRGNPSAKSTEYNRSSTQSRGELPVDSIKLTLMQGQMSSRELYTQLITPPELKPLDWKRSRVRREQLISLGVPVNLDEVSDTQETSRLSADNHLSNPGRLDAPTTIKNRHQGR